MGTTQTNIASHVPQARTPAEDLRGTLSELEAMIGKLGYEGESRPGEILVSLDKAQRRLASLADSGGDLAAERARFGTVTQQFGRKGKAFLRQLGGPEALEELRAKHTPPRENWWWFTDQQLAAQRKAQRRGTLRTLAILALVIAVLAGLYELFLAPDEATRLRYGHEQTAEQALMMGDLPLALTESEQALVYAPEDGNLLVLNGVTLQLLGDVGRAEVAFAQSRQAFGDVEIFLSGRVQAYLLAARADLALLDALQMVDLYPSSAVGYYQLGNVYATLGNQIEASEAYTTAAELASAADQTELEAMARVQLANLMMMMSAPQIPTATPEPAS